MDNQISSFRPVDAHVHIVGNGSSGSGCWMRVTGWHKPLAAFMLRQIGLSWKALEGDLDTLYVENLLKQVRESSLSAIVILGHDLVYDEDGNEIKNFSSFHVPNDYVLELAKKNPEFLPAISIHPARPDALEELERCVAAGAAMMKCLPNCHNIDCGNPRYKKFWERMAELKLPLLAHTGGEHTVPVFDKKLSDPGMLELPLECGVTVIAAHCATKSGLADPQYFHDFAAMTKRFPNLYGDNSAFNVPIRGRHIRECLEEPLASRIIHGSDFPVPVSGLYPWMQRLIDFETYRKWNACPNVLERDYQLKRAMGFSEETFTRIWKLIPERSKRAMLKGA
jgi:predicted TIM-barrel fold metal-dependent hydrolase